MLDRCDNGILAIIYTEWKCHDEARSRVPSDEEVEVARINLMARMVARQENKYVTYPCDSPSRLTAEPILRGHTLKPIKAEMATSDATSS